MINIYVNGFPAVINEDATIEFVKENNLFESQDGYSFDMEFPLRDCPENVKIFGNIRLPFIDKPVEFLPCWIQCSQIVMQGVLAVMDVSEESVTCQFLEGVDVNESKEKLENTFINEMDLGSYPETDPSKVTPFQAVQGLDMAFCYPWAPNGSDEITNNKARDSSRWHRETTYLTWQPRLKLIISNILDRIGYSPDESVEKLWALDSKWRNCIICNTLPPTWEMPGYADALPHWSVIEFFEKLSPLMGGRFVFNHFDKTVSMRPEKELIEEADTVVLSNVLDSYSASVSRDADDSDFLPQKRYRYKDSDEEVWKFLCCPDFMHTREMLNIMGGGVRIFTHWQALKNDADFYADWRNRGKRNTLASALAYVMDIDTFFVLRYHVTRLSAFVPDSDSEESYAKFGEMQPVNVFGPQDYDPEYDYEELDFVPVPIDWTLDGKMMILPVGELDGEKGGSLMNDNYNEGSYNPDYDIFVSENVLYYQPNAYVQRIAAFEKPQTKAEYFDRIYLGFAQEEIYSDKKMGPLYNVRYPFTDIDVVRTDLNKDYTNLLRLNNESVSFYDKRKIDSRVMYSFSFSSNSLPNVKATFIIHGQPYICRKLTATFSRTGMSQIIKGEFYRIISE